MFGGKILHYQVDPYFWKALKKGKLFKVTVMKINKIDSKDKIHALVFEIPSRKLTVGYGSDGPLSSIIYLLKLVIF